MYELMGSKWTILGVLIRILAQKVITPEVVPEGNQDKCVPTY